MISRKKPYVLQGIFYNGWVREKCEYFQFESLLISMSTGSALDI
jgi:hypothetical protein